MKRFLTLFIGLFAMMAIPAMADTATIKLTRDAVPLPEGGGYLLYTSKGIIEANDDTDLTKKMWDNKISEKKGTCIYISTESDSLFIQYMKSDKEFGKETPINAAKQVKCN